MALKPILKKLSSGASLSAEEMGHVFELLFSQDIPESQIGAFLYATSVRLPTPEEIIGAAEALRRHMLHVDLTSLPGGNNAVDTAGTGGTGLDSFNTSTAAAFVCAAAGCCVAKHGNRAASSRCGSADLLEALGIKIDLNPNQVKQCVAATNFGFFFAPRYHTATKKVAAVRREINVRTIFNFLGPLVNPALVKRQLLGVSERKMLPIIGDALHKLGVEKAIVVCGSDGLDEITSTGETSAIEIDSLGLREFVIRPEEYNVKLASLSDIKGFTAADAAKKVREIFSGMKGPYRDVTVLNAGAALYVAGHNPDIRSGIKEAESLLDSGKVHKILNEVIRVTNSV